MVLVLEGCLREARAERGVHAASASKMKARMALLTPPPWSWQRSEPCAVRAGL